MTLTSDAWRRAGLAVAAVVLATVAAPAQRGAAPAQPAARRGRRIRSASRCSTPPAIHATTPSSASRCSRTIARTPISTATRMKAYVNEGGGDLAEGSRAHRPAWLLGTQPGNARPRRDPGLGREYFQSFKLTDVRRQPFDVPPQWIGQGLGVDLHRRRQAVHVQVGAAGDERRGDAAGRPGARRDLARHRHRRRLPRARRHRQGGHRPGLPDAWRPQSLRSTTTRPSQRAYDKGAAVGRHRLRHRRQLRRVGRDARPARIPDRLGGRQGAARSARPGAAGQAEVPDRQRDARRPEERERLGIVEGHNRRRHPGRSRTSTPTSRARSTTAPGSR